LLTLTFSFIIGCQVGLRDRKDKNFAEQGTARTLKKLQRKQSAVGLDDKAATMLWAEVMGARSQLGLHQERYERRFDALPGQLMLQDKVAIEADADGDFEDSLRVFAFDDEGRIM
jgi:hypothetical protein